MKSKLSLVCALAIGAVCVLPLAANAAGTTNKLGQASGSSSGSSTGNDSGTSSGSMGSGASSGTGSSGTSSGSDAGTGSSGAMSGRNTESSMFDQLDRNKDGYIEKSEANRSAQVKSNLKSIDTDGDGKISHEEWNNYQNRNR